MAATAVMLAGDCRTVLPTLPADSVHCCVTSPPYWGLRDYGHEGQIGLEASVAEYVAELVGVFREVRRVLRPDATLWLNLGDGYAGGGYANHKINGADWFARANLDKRHDRQQKLKKQCEADGIKPKDLIGLPWRVAFALQADGWWLRSDVVWCLSGGTRVYARTKKGEMPMAIKDMVRLDPATVQLWNGTKWTKVLGWSETPRPDRTYEIEFRNGQRVGCTAGHLWPTKRGNVRADEIAPGDVVQRCRLPEPPEPREPSALPDEMVGWFVGLYIAEGSRFGGTIQIASHVNEEQRFARLRALAAAYHGTAAVHKTSPNGCTVALNGPMLNGLVDTYVSGRVASDKHLHPRCWQRSDTFLRAVIDGYLSGDGHYDAENDRWRLGFCTNDELVADLRTIGARLGVSVRLRRAVHVFDGQEFAGYRGELRLAKSEHHNTRDDGEVVAIRESRARKFWDIGVADEPHLFALASGILTHNSKPNPMPESVQDRPTRSHEYVFMLSKSATYYFDADAVREPAVIHDDGRARYTNPSGRKHAGERKDAAGLTSIGYGANPAGRNVRSVWTIATQSFTGSHFAVMPAALAERCIKAGCPPGGLVLDPFAGAGTTLLAADRLQRRGFGIELNPAYAGMATRRVTDDAPLLAWTGDA